MYCIFICTGNTCRSPMAAAYFNYICEKDWFADSAGTHAIDGVPAAHHAINVLKEMGIDISSHRSKQLDNGMIKSADYLFTMTGEHKSFIRRYFPDGACKVYRLTEFERNSETAFDIPDPVGGNIEEYRYCFSLIKEAIDAFVSCMKKER